MPLFSLSSRESRGLASICRPARREAMQQRRAGTVAEMTHHAGALSRRRLNGVSNATERADGVGRKYETV
jgi:hypothetical protein